MNISVPNFPSSSLPLRSAQSNEASVENAADGDDWYARQQARDEALDNYVSRAGGEFDNNGTGDYHIGRFHYRTFPGRTGYNESFLGPDVELPQLDESVAHLAAPRVDDPESVELEYTHFSLVQHKMRRMPFFTAVNIDGAQSEVVRDKVKWAYEGRLTHRHQLGNVAYTKNDIDRGHIVHGQSPAWGVAGETGRADTYVYSNIGLQHKGLNQEEWLDLENQLLERARENDEKMTVFAGPVFRDDDKFFDNGGRVRPAVQMPKSFWKVVVWNDPEKGLQSESYVMSQEEDLARKKGELGPKYQDDADLSQYRVPLNELEELTKLKFEDLSGTDNF